MRLDELLVGAGMVDAEAVDLALRRQAVHGGTLGDHLVKGGAITAPAMQSFLERLPTAPSTLEATGIPNGELLALLMKIVLAGSLENRSEIIEAIKLPHAIVAELIELAIAEKLLSALGTSVSATGMGDMRYGLSQRGKQWASEAMQRSRYAGPAPVSLESFKAKVSQQRVTTERLGTDRVRAAFSGLTVPDAFLDQIGPAVNSGRAMLLYGPPGNGKTSMALRLRDAFREIVFVPHAVSIDGQIMRVFDPTLHVPVTPPPAQRARRSLFMESFDTRWVACWRPFVVTGGELTLEMLDLSYDAKSGQSEAPLHVKAMGGCLLIDDFGRQLVSPKALLNRWIIPLENRIDNLKLHNGVSFSLPFETFVIFSTNYEPADLMDPAFLRRIPYKIPVRGPTPQHFREIFEFEAAMHQMDVTENTIDYVIGELTRTHGVPLAAYQPRFLIQQVAAACEFRNETPHFDRALLDHAIANLSVERTQSAADYERPTADAAAGEAESGLPHRSMRLAN